MKSLKLPVPGMEEFGVTGDWYAPYDMMMNDIGFWYPILTRTGVNVPRTIIINADSRGPRDLIHLLDGVEPEGFRKTLQRIQTAMNEIGYPCFFRGGHTSGKHDWGKTCFVKKPQSFDELKSRLMNVIGLCVTHNLGATPMLYENWAVREFIPTTPEFLHFNGMPIVKEFRFFLKDGEVDCFHPYWPKEALKDGTVSPEAYTRLCDLYAEDEELLYNEALKVGKYFPGYWSCDFLKSSTGMWYCTDMAQGADSYHMLHEDENDIRIR